MVAEAGGGGGVGGGHDEKEEEITAALTNGHRGLSSTYLSGEEGGEGSSGGSTPARWRVAAGRLECREVCGREEDDGMGIFFV